MRDSGEKRRSAFKGQKTRHEEDGSATRISLSREAEVGPLFQSTTEPSAEEYVAAAEGHISEGKPLVLLQVNCRSICNKILEFWNLIYIQP